jgi:hypothetical protein
MATAASHRRRGRFTLALGAIIAAITFGTVIASGAELVTAEVDAVPPNNDVTVTQGDTANFNIKLSATGKMDSTITSSNASTASVKTVYSLSSAGALSSSTFSAAKKFYSSGLNCSGGNCDVTWDTAPTDYSVAASVSAAASTPVGDYTITLSPAAGTTAVTNPAASGAKLSDTTATTVAVHVVAPAVVDTDNDGVPDASDNCPNAANSDQADNDGDGIGNVCDSTPNGPDADGDGVPDSSDNCVNVSNPSQADADNDGLGNACDSNSYAPAVGSGAANASGNETDTLTTNGSFTDQDGNGSLTISKVSGAGDVVDNGNGTWSWSLATADDASGSVTVQADDGEHDVATDMFTYNAANVAPTINGFSASGLTGTACQTGNSVTVSFTVSDPADNAHDPITGSINWGDGNSTSISGRSVSESHSYGAIASTITVSVNDDDGGSDGKTASYSKAYVMSGILAPFNADGSSVWKYGSTLPVKVRITDCNGAPVPGLAPQVGTSISSSQTPTDGIDETASTSAADSTGVMRYDSTAGQYIYNFASKNLADGNATYYMYVRGKDSNGNFVTNPSQVSVKFGLRTK